MALYLTTNVLISGTKLSLVLFLVAISITYSESKLGDLKETTFTVYFQNQPSGPKATSIAIGIPGQDWTYGKFGTAFVTDASMTEGFHRSTTEIGRGQGMFVTSAKDGSTLTLLLSIVFTDKEYEGSTLQIQGADHQFENPREVAVVGGTGVFRAAWDMPPSNLSALASPMLFLVVMFLSNITKICNPTHTSKTRELDPIHNVSYQSSSR